MARPTNADALRKARMNSPAFKLKVALGSSQANRMYSHKAGMPDVSRIIGSLDRITAILDERLAARKREKV